MEVPNVKNVLSFLGKMYVILHLFTMLNWKHRINNQASYGVIYIKVNPERGTLTSSLLKDFFNSTKIFMCKIKPKSTYSDFKYKTTIFCYLLNYQLFTDATMY